MRRLQKSRSEVLRNAQNLLQQLALKHQQKPNATENKPKRSSSDDFCRKPFRHQEESLKRAIADGYHNFLNHHEEEKRDKRRPTGRSAAEVINANEKRQQFEVSQPAHKKYKTRTSSAGTLIVEESFSGSHRRRPEGKRHTIAGREDAWRTIDENPDMLFNDGGNDEGCNGCDYTVQEPITPVSDNRKRSDASSGGKREKRKAKLRRRHSIDSTSSSAADKRNRYRKGDNAGKRVVYASSSSIFKNSVYHWQLVPLVSDTGTWFSG